MRVLFINPTTKFNARSVALPLGLIAIASYLQKIGHNICIYDRSVDQADLYTVVKQFRPAVIGVSVIGHKSLPDAVMLSAEVMKRGIPVVWGGPLASCFAETCLRNGYADYVSTGEGELVWQELLEAFDNHRDLATIKGLAYLDNGTYHYLGQHSLADLTDFPTMDFSLVRPQKYFQKSFGCERMLHICAAKGCPNHCTYCYNKDFNLCSYRKRPLYQVMEEIRYLVQNFGMDGVYFTDELWANSREEVHEYCKTFLESGLHFVWGCQTVIGRFTKEDYQLMYDAGCRWIFFGIETGSTDLLKKLGKKMNTEEIANNITYCNACGITSIAAFMIGLPMETKDDLMLTVRLAKRIKPSYYSVNFYYPVPRSALYEQLVWEGKYHPPKSEKKLFRDRPVEKVKKGISDIPSIDLKVVRAYFMWQSFICSNISSAESHDKLFFMKKTVIEAIKSSLHHGIINFFVQCFYSGREFLLTLFYAFCFPVIRKKYDLYKEE